MSEQSGGFIISFDDNADFYHIKRQIQSLQDVKLVYCTISNDRLYIRSEKQLMERGEKINDY